MFGVYLRVNPPTFAPVYGPQLDLDLDLGRRSAAG